MAQWIQGVLFGHIQVKLVPKVKSAIVIVIKSLRVNIALTQKKAFLNLRLTTVFSKRHLLQTIIHLMFEVFSQCHYKISTVEDDFDFNNIISVYMVTYKS